MRFIYETVVFNRTYARIKRWDGKRFRKYFYVDGKLVKRGDWLCALRLAGDELEFLIKRKGVRK